MSEALLNEILQEIKKLQERMTNVEWLLMELTLPEEEPTPEEEKIIKEYQKDKEKGKVKIERFL
ncbi:MAG: hypothetical protein GF308_21350 [Candidatus Heimdallarchaeota archaeon]|nr:hypothetical protein [Candidatus Heimdallarchaeota archaeon]